MKPMREVESTRVQSYGEQKLNTVHRSSLLVPELPKAETEISFLNHFLLKRGLQDVSCRITGIDPRGNRLVSKLFAVTDPKVYVFNLTQLFGGEAKSYQVEFFSGSNLVFPFPAVMVNHRGDGFISQVHAYCRVLNDAFEDEAINRVPVREASIDLDLRKNIEPFLVFMGGQQPCRGKLEISIQTTEAELCADRPLNVPQFGVEVISLRDFFPTLTPDTRGIVKVRQPAQPMFYGRLLVGSRDRNGAFTANHSYYDCSESLEYWKDESASRRIYAFLPQFRNIVRMYPIMSPSTLDVSLELLDHNAESVGIAAAAPLTSPGSRFVEFDVAALAQAAGVAKGDISAFVLSAKPQSGLTPTRINHQIVYGLEGVEASFNTSLFNSNIFLSPTKKGFNWGQVVVSPEFESVLAFVGDFPEGVRSQTVSIEYFDEAGLISSESHELKHKGVLRVDPPTPRGSSPYLWFTVSSPRPSVAPWSVSRHRKTGHCSGEHGF